MSRDLALSLALSLAILILGGAPASVLAQPADEAPTDGVPLTRFLADLDTLGETIAALGSATEARALAGQIPATWRVNDGTERVEVSTKWLTQALTTAPAHPDAWLATRSALRRRLQHLRDESAARSGLDAQARTHARTVVESIVARSEFQQSAASRWREQLQERLGSWFEDLWSRFGRGRATARGTALVFAWTAALAALCGVGYWLARTIVNQPRGTSLSLVTDGTVRLRARELALRALAAASAGQTREAVRCAYGAALVRLEEQGVWRIDDARTPREYLPMLAAADSRRPVMLDLVGRFEQIWYGNRAPAADDARRITDSLEALGCLRPGERAI